ncbi:MAG TPA: winged helix-turn-helix domain-containing protein [Roseiflexaceae bacterium]|nr:winged helix-turn-helix domain-containing protein [Roseiflexaceae bacterium]
MVTHGRAETEALLEGLELLPRRKADDYLAKPFGVEELLARVRVALRYLARTAQGDEPIFEVGDLRVDLARRHVLVAGNEVHLTPIEYKMLATLIEYAGKVITHQQLLKAVWGLVMPLRRPTCGSISGSSGISWRSTRRARAISLLSRAWAIGCVLSRVFSSQFSVLRTDN